MQFDVDVPEEIRSLWELREDAIVKYPAEVLRKIAAPVGKPNGSTRELVEHMKTQMTLARGIGLAAPQVGVSARVIIYRLLEENSPLRVILNPKIISKKGEQIGAEGCLSMPLLQGDVKRFDEIIVKGMDMLGRPFKRRASEMESRVIQHEIDHLDGVLFIDRAVEETLEWLMPEEDDEPTTGPQE